MQKEMTVGFYTGEKVSSEIEKLCDADAALFIIGEFSYVNVKSELEGKNELFLKMGEISRRIKGASFFSTMTDSYGVLKKSVAVFLKGKLIAIADMNASETRLSPSFGLKSVRVGDIKLGVLVGKDLLDVDRIKSLALTENDAIINLSADVFDFDCEKLVSSMAYLTGLTIVSVSRVNKVVALSGGETLFSGKEVFFKRRIILKKRFIERTEKALS